MDAKGDMCPPDRESQGDTTLPRTTLPFSSIKLPTPDHLWAEQTGPSSSQMLRWLRACEESSTEPSSPGYSVSVGIFCQCGSLMSPYPTGRHGNAVLIISLPCWEASFTRAAIPSPVPSLATAEAREDIKLFSGTSLLVFSSVSTPHPTALFCAKVGIRKGRLPVAVMEPAVPQVRGRRILKGGVNHRSRIPETRASHGATSVKGSE